MRVSIAHKGNRGGSSRIQQGPSRRTLLIFRLKIAPLHRVGFFKKTLLARKVLAEAAFVPKSDKYGWHATSREDGAPTVAVASDAAEPARSSGPIG